MTMTLVIDRLKVLGEGIPFLVVFLTTGNAEQAVEVVEDTVVALSRVIL